MKQRKLLSQRHPILYFLAVWYRRIRTYAKWYLGNKTFTKAYQQEPLPFRVKKHQSTLLRKLGNSELQLQLNKVTNLRIALQHINGIVIKPGETFSFCKLVGRPTQKKGYLLGMELSFGKARPGIGGGICQISNMIHWLVIHSPLTVTQRAQHSFDPFPDEGRVLPFGSGAAIFYNYIDYQFTNNTNDTYQVDIWLTDKTIEGELRVSAEPRYKYHIFEEDHQFLKIGDQFFRKNEIWRKKVNRQTGNTVTAELLTKNFARLSYIPEEYVISDNPDERLV
ncbi:vancomycin resistance protein [Taibaiella sp. KBW10]|uniref:VanW family protein n=1 Tax=Taibaiella sp. KBW10 TaxID=2153357 RepID=UPI000F5A2C3C|nr:VanW family protein [Taibaiella sp. KBW10]RQO31881.1 vancomycin resistance protein [Taibaiella sp. KBW10]